MSDASQRHQLIGLEPDNLLAFLALLGLLRSLEHSRPEWRPKAYWDSLSLPRRPTLATVAPVTRGQLLESVALGLAELAAQHQFNDRKDLNHEQDEARRELKEGRERGGYLAEVLAALMSDGAMKEDKDQIDGTPLCLMFGQGHQHFLERMVSVPQLPAPPPRGRGKKAEQITAEQALAEALFAPWTRIDPTQSFRWDVAEDVRYALMFGNPSTSSNKDGTQHGANRLASVGVSQLAGAPTEVRSRVRLGLPGGTWAGGFRIAWPIWTAPMSLAGIVALMNHPALRTPRSLSRLSVLEVYESNRISVGKFMNFTRARVVE